MADNVPKDTSLQSTKQMLDELDALMERMLAMPVNEPEDSAAVPKDIIKGPTLAASLSLLERTPATAEPGGTRPGQKPNPPLPDLAPAPKKPLERRGRTKKLPHVPGKPPHLTNFPPLPSKPTLQEDPAESMATPATPEEALAVPEPEPLTNAVLPTTMVPAIDPLLARVPETPARSSSFSLVSVLTWIGCAPMVWSNQAFDRLTMFLGVGGLWLRSQGGRMVLGFSGIALFLVAVGWILKDWLGWNW